MNEKYIKALSDFTSTAQSNSYFIVGSVALLSYTQKYGYDREIHDIDIIMEATEALKTAERLRELGYNQNTFINPRMPFYSKLMKHSQDRYLRFSKDTVDIEILATSITDQNGLILFEIYPGIKAGIPQEVFTTSIYSNVEFRTVTKEMLYFFKKFANNTFGRKVTYKEQQRYDDIAAIEGVLDNQLFKNIANRCRLLILGLPIKIPAFFYS